jgi:hypothetical protein
MNTSKLLTINLIVFLSLVVISSTFTSCGKEESSTEQPATVNASAVINGSFTSLPETKLEIILQDGQVINRVTLTRFAGTRIVLRIPGTSRATYELNPGLNAIPGATLSDPQQRNYVTRSGRVTVSDYFNRDGFFSISGAFEFRGELYINDSTTFEVNVTNGGFVNVNNRSIQ